MIACWGCYIHIEPLTSLKSTLIATTFTQTVTFFRSKGVVLDTCRMDNQTSPEFRAAAIRMGFGKKLVSSNQKEPNRAERAIQTAKHHIIATRAGFHQDCPHVYLDKCLRQMELTLNIVHPLSMTPKSLPTMAYLAVLSTSCPIPLLPLAPKSSPGNRPTKGDLGPTTALRVYMLAPPLIIFEHSVFGCPKHQP